MTTEKSVLQKALERLMEQGLIDGELRSYRGRGMNERECLSITTHIGVVEGVLLVQELLETGLETLDEWMPEMVMSLEGSLHDSMCRGSITYWPGVPFVQEK